MLFFSDRPVMRKTFLGVPNTFTAVYRLTIERSFLKSKYRNLRRLNIEWTKYLHGRISASIRGMFMKLQPCQYSCIAYKIPQFISHRAIMKSTNFGNVSRLHFKRSFRNSTPSILRALRVNYLCWIAVGH